MALRHWTIIFAASKGYTPRDVAPVVVVMRSYKGYGRYSNSRRYHVTKSSLARVETVLQRYAYWTASYFWNDPYHSIIPFKTYRQVYVLPEGEEVVYD